MNEETKTDLSSLIEAPEQPERGEQAPQEEDVVNQIGAMIDSLQNSFASMHIYARTLDQRIAGLERYVSYLLERDPDVGAKIKDHVAKMEAEEAKANDGSETK